jgi:eukaryotic-like serine/threonine-protein kinase
VHGMGRDGRGAFVVVELVDGSSLRDMLADRGPLPAAGAARVAAGVCTAVAAAHAQGVAHGHLTAANILRTIDGRVKVTDFSLAQAAQRSAQPPDPAADLRSLGRCLGAMLTGREPTDDEPVRLGAEVPAGLAAIAERLTGDRHHGEAYRSAADAGRDLARFRASVRPDAPGMARPRAGPARGAAAAPDAGPPTGADLVPVAAAGRPGRLGASASSPPRERPRRLGLVAALVAGAVVLAGVVAVLGLAAGRDRR